MESGDYFLAENTLDLRFSQDLGDAAFYANAVLYEREGKVRAPELREIYVDYRDESFDLRLNKQQIIWGNGDRVFITDLESFAGAYHFVGDEGDYGQYDDRDGGYVGAKLSF